MARKVFITNLGTNFYGKCKYSFEDFCSSETKFAQQAILELIEARKWSNNDKLIVLTTDDAQKLNWDLEERSLRDGKTVKYSGLKQVLNRMGLAASIKNVPIPDGMNEEEIWTIFQTIFYELEEKDELYIDLTHSFRYHPMLLLVLSNYAKFLRNVTVSHIFYGNYEAREDNIAPIIDLLPIVLLQDWTFAAADYLENGNTSKLSVLSKESLDPILRDKERRDQSTILLNDLIKAIEVATDDFKTCRGLNVYKSKNINKLIELLDNTENNIITPLSPILEKIEKAFVPFRKSNNVENGFHSAKWCYDNGLYQQAITILQENIVTYFCEKHQIPIAEEKRRKIVNSAFEIVNSNIKEDKWIVEEGYEELLRTLVEDDEINNTTLYNSFNRITTIRNDFNHFGMRSSKNPIRPSVIIGNIKKEIDIVFNVFKIEKQCL